jgi:hypothetical protein
MPKNFESIKNILSKTDFIERLEKKGRYVHQEYQDYGLRLASRLLDNKHKSLYIKLAKVLPRSVLEQTVQFSLDYPVKQPYFGRKITCETKTMQKKDIKLPRNEKFPCHN